MSIIFSCYLIPLGSESFLLNSSSSSVKIKEYINQTQPSFDVSNLPPIDYESLYYDWYHPKIEMLIVVPENESFLDTVAPLVEWKNKKGVKTIAVNNYTLYEGIDKAEKIRNLIKSFYEKENIQWVLLMGDATEDLIPTRYVYNPDVVEYGGSEFNGYNDYLKPTDFYFSDLTGTWDEDGDGKWGESKEYNTNGKDEIAWTPNVYVGRFPASSPEELEICVNKTLKYEIDPYIGDWMNRMLLAGGISSYSPPEDETRLTSHIINNFLPLEMNYTHLGEYTSSYTPPDPKEDLTQVSFVNHFNDGYSTVFFAGHGNPFKFIRNPSNDLVYSNINADACTNYIMTPLIYAFACTTSPFDMNDNNIGEILIKRKDSGAIGYIGGLRITWYFEHDTKLEKLNRGNAKLFWKEFFDKQKFQQGKALYDSKVSYMNSEYFENPSVSMKLEYERKNVLTYCLLGDPELDIYTNIPSKIKNPFIDDIFEGQNISRVIRNVYGEIIPNVRISITSNDGLYHTFFSDSEGNCNFMIPALGNKTYNVALTGHNILPSSFNFTTLEDNLKPQIISLQTHLEKIKGLNNLQFSIYANDTHSGIENIFIILSKDDFKNYWIYTAKRQHKNYKYGFDLNVDNLTTGEYSYLVIARDFAENINICYNNESKFEVNSRKIKDNNNLFPCLFTITLTLGLIMVVISGIYKKYRKIREREKQIELATINIRKKKRLDKLKKKKKLNSKKLKRKAGKKR
ncbi:MAG: C25 family cysteine peptidase [Promethearchaeota archaeon]